MSETIQARKQERGVTILLVAVCLAALLAMAALAIDVVTLYVARTEAQRAADAAALAGARMIAGSGYTSSPSLLGPNPTSAVSPGGGVGERGSRGGCRTKPRLLGSQPKRLTRPRRSPATSPTPGIRKLPLPFSGRTYLHSLHASGDALPIASRPVRLPRPTIPLGLPRPIQVSGVKPLLVPNCDPISNTGPAGNPLCAGTPQRTSLIPRLETSKTPERRLHWEKLISRLTTGQPDRQSSLSGPTLIHAQLLAISHSSRFVPLVLPFDHHRCFLLSGRERRLS